MKLKACPFCGGEAILFRNYNYKIDGYFVFVKCLVCSSQSRAFVSPDDPEEDKWENIACQKAIKVWNTRVKDVS